MEISVYQIEAERSANINAAEAERIMEAGLGVASEAGEVAGLIKKKYNHGHEISISNFEEELGDVLWEIAEICSILNVDMNSVAMRNLEKLKCRYPQGFNKKDSMERR